MKIEKNIKIEIMVSDEENNHCSFSCKYLSIMGGISCVLFQESLSEEKIQSVSDVGIPLRTKECLKAFPIT